MRSAILTVYCLIHKLAEGEGLLRPSASSLRENAFAFLSLAMPRRPNPLRVFSSLVRAPTGLQPIA